MSLRVSSRYIHPVRMTKESVLYIPINVEFFPASLQLQVALAGSLSVLVTCPTSSVNDLPFLTSALNGSFLPSIDIGIGTYVSIYPKLLQRLGQTCQVYRVIRRFHVWRKIKSIFS
jgi:hypothetical protein